MPGHAGLHPADRRFEALVLSWESALAEDLAGEEDGLRRLLEELCAQGMEIFVVGRAPADEIDRSLRARPGGPGRLFLCREGGGEVLRVGDGGPARAAEGAGSPDAASWIQDELRRQGIGASLVLLVHDGTDRLHEGAVALAGDATRLAALLADQLRRRRERELPRLDPEPAWVLAIDGLDPELERVHEVLLSVADGAIGTSGSPLGDFPGAAPRVFAAGVYTGHGPETTLLPCPLWTRLAGRLPADARLRRALDLRTGLVRHELTAEDGSLEALLLSSRARPGTVALRARGTSSLLAESPALVAPGEPPGAESGVASGAAWVRVRGSPGGVAAAGRSSFLPDGAGGRSLERLCAYHRDPRQPPAPEPAVRALAAAERAGFETLLREHRRAWVRRWENADVVVAGDPELQLAVRFALFHLMASVGERGEAAVGARGLSGPAYRGHVFWDADVFVLPFLAATHPPSARAILEYRVRRLPAAQAAARAAGRAGARFPWESVAGGEDVTPTSAPDWSGTVVPIRTGQLEDHIVADVAWAAVCYGEWTGDRAFMAGAGRTLLVETARYWASRVRRDDEGRAHIYGVIGPDEYHEPVDDNAFTNVMAGWNLRRAAQAAGEAGSGVEAEEARAWEELADALVDGFDPETGLYEQFAGFHQLEPLVIAEIAPRRPIAADALLGRERVRGAQVLKQADVLMLHHLLPDHVAPGSLLPNLLFYEPRTAHGSSLSPGIHAALLARAGRLEQAVELLRLTSRIDLDDLTGTTAGGLHLAAMGSLWQALALGFAGLKPRGEALELDPRLPPAWQRLELRLRFRGSGVGLRIEEGSAEVLAEPPVPVTVPEAEAPLPAGPGGLRLERRGDRWSMIGR